MKFFNWLIKSKNQIHQFVILKDKVVDELALNSKSGPGRLWIQLLKKRDGTNYLLLKAKGGEATVWVPLEFGDFENAIEFAQRHKPAKP